MKKYWLLKTFKYFTLLYLPKHIEKNKNIMIINLEDIPFKNI